MAASPPAQRLHLALERMSSLFRAQLREIAVKHGLKLVQLEALLYLSRANRYSDTAGAVGEYLCITKGTASQTIMALERRGLLTKEADADDARVQRCRLTPDGQAIAREASPPAFLASRPNDVLEPAADAAVELLRHLQAANRFRTFGQCRSCAHFEIEGSRFRCGLTKERLTQSDAERLCREHEPRASADG